MAENALYPLIDQIKQAASTVDQAARRGLIDTLRRLAIDLETPGESMQRIMFNPILPAICRVGNNLNLFEILSKSNSSITTKELSVQTKCDPLLMSRLLRLLAASHSIAETGEETWAASQVTEALATSGIKAGVNHNFENSGVVYQALPEFLEATNYQNPNDIHHCPWQVGHKTDLSVFDWLGQHPKILAYTMEYMTIQRGGIQSWLDVFPIEEKSKALGSERVLLVDVGGGIGHVCMELKKRFPSLPGRVILEDKPEVVAAALPTEGVEALASDFFLEQPIKDAKFYYMRNVLHDYPDERCRDILSQTRAAMGPDSVLLVDEMVLPKKGASLVAMEIDITMLAVIAGMERTETQWTALLDSAGFKIAQTYRYSTAMQDSVLACVLK